MIAPAAWGAGGRLTGWRGLIHGESTQSGVGATEPAPRLGTGDASEQLLRDLYIELRAKIRRWAAVTKQTPQARMGYVGQHLVSVVTGYEGGRSGARGKDLILSATEFAEIKTCYRIDQLGNCLKCGARVASVESKCPNCGSSDIERHDDSKWLIGFQHEDDFRAVLQPKWIFLALFEFAEPPKVDTIQTSIWRVDPHCPGFALCLVDYRYNIQANSKSGAPFNLWPYLPKFDLMRPLLIYRARIESNDSVLYLAFSGRDPPQPHLLKPLAKYSRSTNLSSESLASLAIELSACPPWLSARRRYSRRSKSSPALGVSRTTISRMLWRERCTGRGSIRT